jgi:hypothetical protein
MHPAQNPCRDVAGRSHSAGGDVKNPAQTELLKSASGSLVVFRSVIESERELERLGRTRQVRGHGYRGGVDQPADISESAM